MTWELVYKNGLWKDIQDCPELPEILKLCLSKDEKILDIGCSYGRLTIPLAKRGFFLTGVDIVKDPLDILKNKIAHMKNVEIQKCGIAKLPFKGNVFDGCIAINSLYHGIYKEVIKSVKEIERVLKPQGWFYGTFLSQEDGKFGQGVCLGENTFIVNTGADPDVPHWFASRNDIADLFKKWEIKVLNHNLNETEYGKSAHWLVVAINKSNLE